MFSANVLFLRGFIGIVPVYAGGSRRDGKPKIGNRALRESGARKAPRAIRGIDETIVIFIGGIVWQQPTI
jgi:hypothetical protein